MFYRFQPLRALLLACLLSSASHAGVELKDLYGNSTPFESLKGKWVFINYWAEWCQSCLDEIPELNRFYEKHRSTNVAFFAVNYDGLPEFKQKKLARYFKIQYPNLSHDPARALNLGDITGVPVTFVFNPQGKLVKKLFGGQSAGDLERVIR